ncbi:MAG TPA: ABC transporter transmembrane domain-containing protein, partial [candidate division Zixibacteria bacterium]|nr:ABC transporter transmembrane domain-containing protein [candidate division Zixibacteria bacterium]
MTAELYEHEDIGKDEKDVSVRRAFRGLLPFLAAHKKGLALCLLLLVAVTAMTLAWPWLIQQAIDKILRGQLDRPAAERDFSPLVKVGLTVVLLQIASLALMYIQRVKLETIGQNVMLDLKRKLFDHILSLDVSYFDKNPVGRVMARVESDTESLRMLFTNTVVLIVGDVVLIVGILGVMFYHHPRLALVLSLSLPAL